MPYKLRRLIAAFLAGAAAASTPLLLLCGSIMFSYQRFSLTVNDRWAPLDPRAYVTPGDLQVQATVRVVTYGNIDPADERDFKLYLRMLFDWVSVNIKPRGDSLYPQLPSSVFSSLSFIDEVWQYPNETLELRCGDCEDSALLLLSMVRFYSPRLRAACIVAAGNRSGHMAVIAADRHGKAAILDPALYYCTRDEAGMLAFKPLAEEIPKWLSLVEGKVGSGAKVIRLFNDEIQAEFKSTNEFITYFKLCFSTESAAP